MRSQSRRSQGMLILAVGFMAIWTVSGSSTAAEDTPVLHEFVPEVDDSELAMVMGEGQVPTAIVYDGELLAAPPGGGLRQGERSMSARPGTGTGQDSPGRRSPTFRPDRVTSLDGNLGYFEVFTPAVAPFKRVTSLDAIAHIADGTPVLGVAHPALEPIEVVGAHAPLPDGRPRDRFWGSVVLDFRSGDEIPFPSVSPESRILTLTTEPAIDLEIARDGSGNYVARTTAAAGEIRVIFLTDAPRSYFNAPEIPMVASNLLEAEVPPLEPELTAEALLFAQELGLEYGDDLPEVLATLTGYFRSFVESDEPPEDTGRIYLDLARSQRGVCRHRSYAFLITAQALGIPTRFVHNEAHSWVEVKMVEIGWMRIDLGGAAGRLEVNNTEDRPVYRAAYADPLPRPSGYGTGYSRLAGDVQGLRNGEAEAVQRADLQGSSSRPADRPAPTPGPMTRNDPRPLRLLLDRQEHEALRGQTVVVSGRALDPDGHGVAGLRIEVHLQSEAQRLLGVTVTGEGGTFQAVVGVPPNLEVGDYALLVQTPGDSRHFPARAH